MKDKKILENQIQISKQIFYFNDSHIQMSISKII